MHKSSLDSDFFALSSGECTTILDGFCNLSATRRIGAGQICNGAGHLQHAVIGACRPAETVTGFAQQRFAGCVRPTDLVDFAAAQFAVGFALTGQLPGASFAYPRGNGYAWLVGVARARGEFGRCERG